jgi:hypothetical protein
MNGIGIPERSPDRPAGGTWCGDPEAWRFVLGHYLPALAAFNLLWEVAQLPLYTLWKEAPRAYIAYAVLHCTVGDVLIGVGALLTVLIATRASVLREWHWMRLGVVAVLIGLAYTAFSEWMNTVVRAGWTYSEWMPVLPFVPIGLSPVLQWVVVPTAALVFSRRRALPRPARPVVNHELGDQS